MKITKMGDLEAREEKRKRTEEEIELCSECPCCGAKGRYLYRNLIKVTKYNLFSSIQEHILHCSCSRCGAEWESEPLEYYEE